MVDVRSLIVLRGLPGAGKSELAGLLSENGKHPVFSVDSYFTDQDGNYRFIHTENHLAYRRCEEQTERAMQQGISKIFLDNTFTMEWEMENYFRMARTYDYRIYVVTVENRHGGRNVHGVPDEQLIRMSEKYKVVLR